MEGEVEGQNSAPPVPNGESNRPRYNGDKYPALLTDGGKLTVIMFPGASPEPFPYVIGEPDRPQIEIRAKAPKTPPPQPPESVDFSAMSKKELMMHQNVRTAESALAYYNKKHLTDYKLVDALESNGFLVHNIWYHTNFTAMPSTPHNGDASAKLFFAEMEIARPGCRVVNCCRVVEGGKTVIGCEFCKGGLVHPTRGFRQGLHRQEYRALRSRNCPLLPRVVSAASSQASYSGVGPLYSSEDPPHLKRRCIERC